MLLLIMTMCGAPGSTLTPVPNCICYKTSPALYPVVIHSSLALVPNPPSFTFSHAPVLLRWLPSSYLITYTPLLYLLYVIVSWMLCRLELHVQSSVTMHTTFSDMIVMEYTYLEASRIKYLHRSLVCTWLAPLYLLREIRHWHRYGGVNCAS